MREKLEQRSFLLLLIAVTLLFFWLLQPFFGAIFWAVAAAILFYPAQNWLVSRWGERPNINALLTLLLCTVVAVVPLTFVVMLLVDEGMSLYQRLESGSIDIGGYVERLRQAVPAIDALTERFNIDLARVKSSLADGAMSASQAVASRTLTMGQNVLQVLISLAIMLYLIFFFLRDGDDLVRLLIRALPLGDARERMLFAKFAAVTRATIKGNLVVALVQGLLGGLIFWALGLSGAVLWGVVMAFTSLVPAVGPGLIWAPVAIYSLLTGDIMTGVILIAFGVLVIGLVDNVLRPILVGRDTKMPDYLVLLSTLGGLTLFGLNGFVIGPLIAALFLAFWDIFMREINTGP
jgi:predicted PurR-regulated permease PerM